MKFYGDRGLKGKKFRNPFQKGGRGGREEERLRSILRQKKYAKARASSGDTGQEER